MASAETLFAKALENETRKAFERGLSTDDFWKVLAGFVGFSMGNAPENDRETIIKGVRQFAEASLLHALDRRKEITKEATQ